MRRLLTSRAIIVATAWVAVLAVGCQTTKPSNGKSEPKPPVTHASALKQAAGDLAKGLAGVKGAVAVAGVFDLERNRQTEYSARLEEEIVHVLAKQKNLTLVARRRVRRVIHREQAFQQSLFVDPTTAAELGKLLSAKAVVTGTYQRQGEQIRLLLRAVQVQTGKVVATSESDLPATMDAKMQMLGEYRVNR